MQLVARARQFSTSYHRRTNHVPPFPWCSYQPVTNISTYRVAVPPVAPPPLPPAPSHSGRPVNLVATGRPGHPSRPGKTHTRNQNTIQESRHKPRDNALTRQKRETQHNTHQKQHTNHKTRTLTHQKHNTNRTQITNETQITNQTLNTHVFRMLR